MSSRRGQSMVEYAAMIAIVVAALLAMQIYMKRGVSGRLRQGVDSMGGQYDPKNTSSNFTISTKMDTTTTSTPVPVTFVGAVTGEQRDATVLQTTTTINNSTTTRSGTETVGPLGNNLFEKK